jgi:hypothetical protein
LLAAAFSQSYFGTPDTLAVSLSVDSSEKSSVSGSDKVQVKHEISKPNNHIIHDKISRDKPAPSLEEEVTSAEEPGVVSTPEKIPEAQEQVASGMSASREKAMWLAQIHHAYITQTRAFMDGFSQSIQKGLLKAIESNRVGGLHEGTAEVTFFFNDEGGMGEVWGATNSEVLESALNRLDWQSVPLPGAFRLKIKGLHVMIRIEKGEPFLSFTVL